ncbi:hypothetical protein Peetri_00003 [Pseudomonas phage vB_PpuM-Peetri]
MLNVFDLIKSKMPNVHIEEARVAEEREMATAGLSNDDPLVCPVCKQPTQPIMGGNNVPMLICEKDRVAMPVPEGA